MYSGAPTPIFQRSILWASQVVKFDLERVITRRVYEFKNAESRDKGVVFTIYTLDIVAAHIKNGLVTMAPGVTR